MKELRAASFCVQDQGILKILERHLPNVDLGM
jgi:hypothetical protein